MRQLREAVVAFLNEHATYTCVECLAFGVKLPLLPTTMVTLGLQEFEWFETSEGLCSRCHRRTRVVRVKK
jgi:hypothetical protein